MPPGPTTGTPPTDASWPTPPAPNVLIPPRPTSRSPKALIISLIVLGLLGMLGVGGFILYSRPNPGYGDALVNYRETRPEILTREHVMGDINYPVTPPVGGNHHPMWQSCMGDVYDERIPDEHAVHSLEHGAVWITYDPERVTADDIRLLAERVEGIDFMMLSPYPGQESPISLQAWGYQLRVATATDERIDRFIQDYRITASIEAGAACSAGVNITGTTPLDLY